LFLGIELSDSAIAVAKEAQFSGFGSAMDATQEARCKEMLDQILVKATKMASDLAAAFRAVHRVPV
jgi:hypothetical protein